MIDIARAYATYAPELRRYVARRADGAADADDVVQDVFASLLRSAAHYHDAELRGLLYAITASRVADVLRRQSVRWRRDGGPLIEIPTPAPDDAIIDRLVSRAQVADLLTRARLTEPQRQAIERLFFRDESIEQVAAVMGITYGAAKALRHRAIVALREVANEY